jgi:hypothetical protein
MRYSICSNLALLFFLLATLMAKADIQFKNDGIVGSIKITGIITERDAAGLQDFLRSNFALVSVTLNSIGGDVSTAINIGRLARKYDATTVIRQNEICYSSCALIFVAGVSRVNLGALGLHRPYLSSAHLNREMIEKQVPLMLSMIKNYLTEMGLTDTFYQQMVNTEPAKMVSYGVSDISSLVPATDPVYEEVMIGFQARRYGITTSEVRRREKDVEDRCLFDSTYITCGEAIRWGLSEPVYIEQETKANNFCLFSDGEQTILNATPTKLRPDLAFYIRKETCVRNMMLGRMY